jgi:hypothetical protein
MQYKDMPQWGFEPGLEPMDQKRQSQYLYLFKHISPFMSSRHLIHRVNKQFVLKG